VSFASPKEEDERVGKMLSFNVRGVLHQNNVGYEANWKQPIEKMQHFVTVMPV
jgi:hypothetical protein